jgi:DNA-binding LytR/AlgR family response regulator
MKVLIIEDEWPAAKRLIALINEVLPDPSIVGHLDSIESTVDWFKINDMPDLVFMDIQLADGYSFEIFNQIDVSAPIIFTTAYDEYALEAFKVNSIDYLLKPIEKSKLEKSLLKLNRLSNNNITETVKDLNRLIDQLRVKTDFKKRFLIKQKNRLITIRDEQIAYFHASNKLVELVTFEKRHFIMDETLEQYEVQVDPSMFFRLNRSILANRSAIQDIITHFNGKLKIHLKPDMKEEIFVSREKASVFKQWLEE